MNKEDSKALYEALLDGEWVVSWIRGDDIIQNSEKILSFRHKSILVVHMEDTDHFISDDDYTIVNVNGTYVVNSNTLVNGTIVFEKV